MNTTVTFGADVNNIANTNAAFYASSNAIFPTQLTSTMTRITDTGTVIKDSVSRSDYSRFVKGHMVPSNPTLVPLIS